MNKIKSLAFAGLSVGVGVLAFAGTAQAGKTLDGVKQRNQLICGVNPGLAGFGAADSQGKWTGLDVDVCRAVATAVLSDPEKVKYVPLNAQQRFTALQSGEIDILSRNTTFTLTRDASLGLTATSPIYYDGQGFLAPKKLKAKSAKQLKNAAVCVQSGTTTEKNLNDYFKAAKVPVKPVVFEALDAAKKAFFSGRCQVFTADASALASIRNEAPKPDELEILPELISKEPLGPMVRRGDDEWTAVVKWVIYALLEAEEYGVDSANVDQMKTADNPNVQRILGGGNEDSGKLLGLDKDWAARTIKAVGNYGEIFDRNVGAKSQLKLPRGLNNLWNKGGIQYGMPIR